MKLLFRCLVAFTCLFALVLPTLADEVVDEYEKDARYAEGVPPMVPHRIDDKTSAACLGCHRDGLGEAPITPHPIRLDCTQCHGQGEIKGMKNESKHDKKSKRK